MTEEAVDEFDAAFDELANEDKADDVLLEDGSSGADPENDTDLQASSGEPTDQTKAIAETGAGSTDGEPQEVVQGSEAPSLAAIQIERDQLLQYKRSNEGRVSALQQKINQLEHQRVPQQPTRPPANVTPEKWGEFEEEYPEIAQAINARMGAMEQTVQRSVEGRIGQAVQPLQQAEHQRFLSSQYAALDAAHPDWKDVVRSGPFTQWLSAQPTAVQGFMNSEDARDASYLLDTYKHNLPQSSEEPVQADPKVTEIQAQREKKLRDAQGIKSRPAPGATGGIPDDFDSAFDAFVRDKERVSR